MASLSGNNKIVLKGDYGQYEEGPLTLAAKPGQNVRISPAASQYARDSYTPGGTDYIGTGTGVTVTGGQQLILLREDGLTGGTLDTAWAAGSGCLLYIPKKGDVVQVLVASGQTVVKSKGLTAGTDGKFVTDASNPSVEALESSSGALGADTHVRVRVL